MSERKVIIVYPELDNLLNETSVIMAACKEVTIKKKKNRSPDENTKVLGFFPSHIFYLL